MTRRTAWTVGFLGVTAVAVGAEIWAAFDGNPDTVPWTDYLVKLPWWVLIPGAVLFAGWLVYHLVTAKLRQMRGEDNPKGTT